MNEVVDVSREKFAADVAEMIAGHIFGIRPDLGYFQGYGNLKFQIESFQE